MNPSDKSATPAAPAAAAATPVSAEEAALKARQLKAQTEKAEFDLAKAKRDDRNARREVSFKLRQLKATARKAEVDLANAEREASKANAAAAEACTYQFYDGVDWETTRRALEDLSIISRRFPGKPLTVVLNSPGGSVIAGLAVYDHIDDLRRKGHHVTVKCRGMAASMGGILLQAGDKRIIGPESMVLIHAVSSGAIGEVNHMQDRVDFSKRLWEKLSVILSRRSKMTPEAIREKAFKFDWWLSAEEAVELGFADEIG